MMRRLPDRGNNIVDDSKEDEVFNFFSKANNINEGSNDLIDNNPEEKIFQSPSNHCYDDSMQSRLSENNGDNSSFLMKRGEQRGPQRRLFMDELNLNGPGGVIL